MKTERIWHSMYQIEAPRNVGYHSEKIIET